MFWGRGVRFISYMVPRGHGTLWCALVFSYLEGEPLLVDEGHGPARDLLVAHVPSRLWPVLW